MSLVISAQRNGCLYMIADRIVTDGHGTITTTKIPKIHHLNNGTSGLLIGVTGPFRLINIIRFKLELPVHEKGVDASEYVEIDLVESIKKILEEEGWDQKEGYDWSMAVGYQSKLFEVTFNSYAAIEVEEDISCIGAGMSIGYGAMLMGLSIDLPIEACMEKSIEIAAKHHVYVQGPFDLLKLPPEPTFS